MRHRAGSAEHIAFVPLGNISVGFAGGTPVGGDLFRRRIVGLVQLVQVVTREIAALKPCLLPSSGNGVFDQHCISQEKLDIALVFCAFNIPFLFLQCAVLVSVHFAR